MTNVNYDKIMEHRNRLKKHDGFLPLLIRCVMMEQHRKHLMDVGLYDVVIKEEIETIPNTLDKAIGELVEWCGKNTEYEDIIR